MTAPAGPCQDPGGCLGVPDPQVAERRGLQRPGLRPLLLDHASAAQVRRGQIHLGAWLIRGGGSLKSVSSPEYIMQTMVSLNFIERVLLLAEEEGSQVSGLVAPPPKTGFHLMTQAGPSI